MIELSSGVAVAARSPAVRPRRGAGSLGQRPAPAPPTRSHGARGARCRPDPLPLAGGLRELPGCRPRSGGGTAAGRVAVGRERPTRPLRLQMPQPADHAYLRLLPALPGTGTAARPGPPRAAGRAGGAPESEPRSLRARTSRPARPPGPPSLRVDFTVGGLAPSFPAPSLLPRGKRRLQPVPSLLSSQRQAKGVILGSAVLWIPRVGGCGVR